ncbi:MAG: hypothetical protein ACLGID_00375 [Gammaproteobacteria bacterium]
MIGSFQGWEARREATRTPGQVKQERFRQGLLDPEGQPEMAQAGTHSIGGHCLPSERTAGGQGHEVAQRFTRAAQ